ncbi:hypothetical protein BN159_7444 [Streptomyces davaonensis JCM 4913]|uniref:Uncharacterized protein n=1 Tax=Streptomyces davaonensis (strain DSM 101723 / JCM 4913 / KCC S-0913 / 768) TaxID=1214101 RepID=K4RDQ5_STRDJ|nr:hypothetical protein [Streptomyces davaonensis]CCK31823.1 hypothetical protein BN159_7444 [Streptomyces davaonensis JCM 4913]
MNKALRSAFVLDHLIGHIVSVVATGLVEQIGDDAPDPGPRKVPRDLRLWLARLRLLEAVPFAHLVADATLLPPESIRFFHVDRGWTDALVEGALSVGTVTSADRSALEQLYGTVRTEVDEAERLVRLPGREPGAAVPSGPAGPVTGFLLRSRMVSGWPGIHVRGYAEDNLRLAPPVDDDEVGDAQDRPMRKLGLLRLERLAPAVLLALFDGLPAVVHLEEPRAGVQFGVDETESGGRVRAEVHLRDPATGDRFAPARTVEVPFRKSAPGVLHLRALAERMTAAAPELGATLDAAEFALQMVQFPYRAVFADRTLTGGPPADHLDAFRPGVGYTLLKKHFGGGQ